MISVKQNLPPTMNRRDTIDCLRHLQRVKPRADWVAATRTLLLAQIQRQGDFAPVVLPTARWTTAASFWQSVTQKFSQPVVSFVAVLGLVMVSSLTVNAAFYSLPGDSLYRVKLAFERTQLAMVSDTTRKAELKLEFARNRVKELGHLVSQQSAGRGTPQEVSRVVSRFAEEAAGVRRQLQRLPADTRAAFTLAVSVEQAGTELAQQLKVAIVSSSDINQVARQALAAAEATSFSALEGAIAASVTATSSSVLPTDDVRRYLREKVVNLRAMVRTARVSAATSTDSNLRPSVEADLDQADLDIEAGDFTAALAAINAIRQRISPAEPSASGVAPDGGVASTTAASTPTKPLPPEPASGGVAGETTQGFLP